MGINIRQERISSGSPPDWKICIGEEWSVSDCQSTGDLERFLHENKIDYNARPDYGNGSKIFKLDTTLMFEKFDPMAETLLRLLGFKNKFVK